MIHDLVRRARSTRRFVAAEPILPETVRELVDLARLSPCGGNKQSLRYRIVTRKEECEAVFPLIAWAAGLPDWKGPAEAERPTAYIAICGETDRIPPMDVGIAAQTIQLAATDLGYAACQLGSIQRPRLREALHLPEGYDIALLVALGKPGETVVLETLAPGGGTGYWRDGEGAHHVPKRPLEEVLL